MIRQGAEGDRDTIANEGREGKAPRKHDGECRTHVQVGTDTWVVAVERMTYGDLAGV